MSEIGGSRGSAWQTRVRAAGFPPSSTSSGTRASVRGPGAPGHRGGPAGPSSLFADRHDAIGTVAPRDRRSQGTMEPPHSRAQLVLRPGTCDRPPGGARDQSRAEADPPSRRGRLRWLARDRSRWRSRVGGWEARERGTGRGGATRRRLGSAGPVAVAATRRRLGSPGAGTGRGGGHASAAGRPGSAGPVAVGPAAGRPPPAPGRPPPETTRSRRCGPLVVVWGAHARQSDHGRRPGERGGRFGAKRAPNRPQVPRSPCRWSIGGDGTG